MFFMPFYYLPCFAVLKEFVQIKDTASPKTILKIKLSMLKKQLYYF
jgi:hypothetical protein